MKLIIQKRFRSHIRKREAVKAAFTKHIFPILGVVFSAVWLLIWGIDLITVKFSNPHLKIFGIVLGYCVPISALIIECRQIQRKLNLHDTHRKILALQRKAGKNT